MRIRVAVLSIWLCFLLRGWFYASMFPLWEGFDEFAHFAVIRAMAVKGTPLIARDQPVARDVDESLKLAPVPWQLRKMLSTAISDEEYWSLPPQERQDRETRLREMPAHWHREDSTGGIIAYESLQAPLYYWLMTPVLLVTSGCSLPTQVLCVRWFSVAIASLAIPLVFAIGRSVTRDERAALGCAAVVAIMPGFATDVARVANESLAAVLFSLLIWLGLEILTETTPAWRPALLGLVLGLGLLTKAYFLTALPAVLLLVIYRYRSAYLPYLSAFGTAFAVAGWWYVRNLVTTGTLAGLSESVTLRSVGVPAILGGLLKVPWGRAVDVILVSHLYFCGWSSLIVRSWMYHALFVIALVAALGLVVQLRQRTILWLIAVYGAFWIGQFYNVVLQYLTKGLAGSMGWYMYAVVACEVVLFAAGLGRRRV